MEDLREKSVNFWIRLVLRAMAWVTLMFYMIYRIIKPVIVGERLEIDKTDAWVMMFCIGLLLAIEAVKAAYEKFIQKKTD